MQTTSKKCIHCGCTFDSANTRKIYCSEKCCSAAHYQRHGAAVRVARKCRTCGMTFTTSNKRHVYCGMKCCAKMRNAYIEPVVKECNFCHTPFVAPKNIPNRKIYCSALCSRRGYMRDNPNYRGRQAAAVAAWRKRQSRESNEKIRAYNREYQRKWRAENREKVRARARASYWAHREHNIARAKERNRVKKYGVTTEIYNRMLKQQQGKCALCRKAPCDGKPLHVDHCHKSGATRELLCARCNTKLAAIENEEFLSRGMAYIAKHAEQNILTAN